MALLGRYYAAKIRGATELAWFRATGAAPHRARAVGHLESAARYAHDYAARMSARYAARIWTNRVGNVDFAEFEREAAHDVEIAASAAAIATP
jgi:hypothetical protein